jgi:hypothetical protein
MGAGAGVGAAGAGLGAGAGGGTGGSGAGTGAGAGIGVGAGTGGGAGAGGASAGGASGGAGSAGTGIGAVGAGSGGSAGLGLGSAGVGAGGSGLGGIGGSGGGGVGGGIGSGEAAARQAIWQSFASVPGGAAAATGRPALVRSYVDPAGYPCRTYLQTVMIDGKPVSASAAVCQGRDGKWALSTAQPEALSGSSGPRSVAPEDFHCPTPGTVIETSVGGWLQFTGQEGLRCWYRTRSGTTDSRYALLLAGDSDWVEQGGDEIGKLWPLRVGKRQWFVARRLAPEQYYMSWYEIYTVTGRERITVPAGTFDTYVITWEEKGRFENGFEAKSTFWYAPEVGYFVKFRADPALGSGFRDWHATRIVAPRPAVAPVAAGGGDAAEPVTRRPSARPVREATR